MVSTLLCKPPLIVGLSTLITRGLTHWYFLQFVMRTIGMSVVFVCSSLYVCHVSMTRINRQTDRQTHKPSTVTLAAHACRGLMITVLVIIGLPWWILEMLSP